MTASHLTPEKLLGPNKLPAKWSAAKVAFVCFTPFPNELKKYVEESAPERYFVHSPNAEVRLCRFDGIPFVVISEVYGFAVGATTVEELVHYEMENIIAIGYSGAFSGIPLGQYFVAKDTMSDLPIASHYGVAEHVRCAASNELYTTVNACIENENNWHHATAWTGNSLYRESPQLVKRMRDQGCDVVNLDTLSIYAVAPVCARDAHREVGYIYVGTVTDAVGAEVDDNWTSDLNEVLNNDEPSHPQHDHLVKMMVETVLPCLHKV